MTAIILKRHIRFQQDDLETATCEQADLHLELTHRTGRQAQQAASDWEGNTNLLERNDATKNLSPTQSIQAAVALVDKLSVAPANQDLLAELTKVIHRTVRLHGNTVRQGNDPAGTESVLSAAHEPPVYQDQGSPDTQNAKATLDAGDLHHQIIMVVQARDKEASIHDRQGFHPDLRDHIRARLMERYGMDYEASIPRLTSGIAPTCFGYEVITHQFGVKNYSGNTKPNLWLSDYLTSVEMTHGDIGNTLRHVPLCLSGSA